ncbi:Cpe/LpqF family protein [Rhizohabitans arisaemae]|uniref:Cpe/LpqF family protein n=1 Tax=Rhizohabitans arisaemae TaxID=2720610 RepID=UPI0024B0AD4D|nr:Cpe/LpqF family protein [Rhizohabitans arisaemae]
MPIPVSPLRVLAIALALAISVITVTACSAEPEKPVTIPSSEVGKQLSWLVGALPRLPLKENELKEHFTESWLAEFPVAKTNEFLHDSRDLKLEKLIEEKPEKLVARIVSFGQAYRLTIGVDEKNKIDLLEIVGF